MGVAGHVEEHISVEIVRKGQHHHGAIPSLSSTEEISGQKKEEQKGEDYKAEAKSRTDQQLNEVEGQEVKGKGMSITLYLPLKFFDGLMSVEGLDISSPIRFDKSLWLLPFSC